MAPRQARAAWRTAGVQRSLAARGCLDSICAQTSRGLLGPRATAAHGGDAGFTLLEVLVAAVIAGLALAVLFRGAAGSVQAARVAAHVQEATSRARSRLSALELAPPVASEQAGDDGGGYRWRTRVAMAERGGGFALFDVSVLIAWNLDGGERRVELRSRQVAAAPPEPP